MQFRSQFNAGCSCDAQTPHTLKVLFIRLGGIGVIRPLVDHIDQIVGEFFFVSRRVHGVPISRICRGGLLRPAGFVTLLLNLLDELVM
jgi:hypothetical protein